MSKMSTDYEMAKKYGNSVYWWRKRRMQSDGPPFQKIGRSIRYDEDVVAAYFAKRKSVVIDNNESEHSYDPEAISQLGQLLVQIVVAEHFKKN